MNDEPSTDLFIERALQQLEERATIDQAIKDRASQRMRDAFIAAHTGEPTSSRPARGQAELVRLGNRPSGSLTSKRKRSSLLVAAAAVLAVVGGVLYSINQQDAAMITAATDSIGASLTEDLADLPVQLSPASYTTDALGTPITFEVAEPIWLVNEQPGWIEFVVDDPEAAVATRLVLLRPGDVEAQLMTSMTEWIAMNEDISFQRAQRTVGGQSANVWSVFVANPVVEQGDCETGQPCVPVFSQPQELGFRAGGSNDVIEISQGDYSPIYAMTWLSPADAPLPNAFGPILDSLSFGDLAAGPLDVDS